MIFLNGKFVFPEQVKIEHNDRGFLLSDGLFETMRSYSGHVFCLKEHWERLQAGAAFLEIPIPYSFSEFEQILVEILIQNGLTNKDASLRLTITRGTGPRGLLPPTDPKPTFMLAAFPFAAHASQPANTFITKIRRNEFSPLCNIKSLSYLDNVLARREAVKNGADEGILLNTQGNVAEASAANIFMVDSDGIVVTPRLEDGALPGITRRVVIDICKELGIEVSERTSTQQELLSAKEVFLTNSLIEIQPVKKINHQLISEGVIGALTQKIQEAYQARINRILKKHPW